MSRKGREVFGKSRTQRAGLPRRVPAMSQTAILSVWCTSRFTSPFFAYLLVGRAHHPREATISGHDSSCVPHAVHLTRTVNTFCAAEARDASLFCLYVTLCPLGRALDETVRRGKRVYILSTRRAGEA